MFLKGTLDKVGASADFEKIGDYKTAPNQLTQTTYTPAHREMSEWLTRDMYEQLVRGIAEGRKKRIEDVRALIDQGPFIADQALARGTGRWARVRRSTRRSRCAQQDRDCRR